MSVRLVWATPDADALLARIARVSNPSNQSSNATAPRLLRYMISHKHWSPFEMASVCMDIITTRDIARQMLRHRSFSFQEFCVAGNTKVTFEVPKKAATGKRSAYKVPIDRVYRNFAAGRPIPSVIRVFDQKTQKFTTSRVRGVFQTGVKPTFRVTLVNGRSIECTKEHKFLTPEGFLPLEDAIGLRVVNGRAVMSKPDAALACNGAPVHTDKEWLLSAKAQSIQEGNGLAGIAANAGCTTHTIRKWLKRHGIMFTKHEVASYTPAWNKGLSGYSRGHHTAQTIAKMRASARKGEASNLWRGGVDRGERLKIADWCAAHRADFLRDACYKCARCGNSGALELHHIEPVYSRPDLAYDPRNIQVTCAPCHRQIHRLNGDAKVWRSKGIGNTLTVHWSKVKSINYVGDQMTYDLEVDHDSHNYVGNGIVVHNSQRYAGVEALPSSALREARMQDKKNRQSSTMCEDAALAQWWLDAQHGVRFDAINIYGKAIRRGIAKEVARAILPEGLTTSRLYMAGNVRSWLHYCDVRRDPTTQAEHRDIADACWSILRSVCPAVVEAWEDSVGAAEAAIRADERERCIEAFDSAEPSDGQSYLTLGDYITAIRARGK